MSRMNILLEVFRFCIVNDTLSACVLSLVNCLSAAHLLLVVCDTVIVNITDSLRYQHAAVAPILSSEMCRGKSSAALLFLPALISL